MGYTVVRQCLDDRVATYYFSETFCRRVAVVCGFNVGGEYSSQFRQSFYESACQIKAFVTYIVSFCVGTCIVHVQSGFNLSGQQSEQFFHVHADVVFQRVAVY